MKATFRLLSFQAEVNQCGPVPAKADILPPESMTYTVTYDLQEGILISGETTETVENNSCYNAMPIVSRAGYTFGGWYTGSGGSGSSIKQGDTLAFLNNHTLYTYWVEAFITVTFDEQGGSENGISMDIRFNNAYSDLPTTNRPGYTFCGWWTEANGEGIEVTENTQVTIPINHTLYAKWIANSYTVTFDPQDGVFTSGEETKELTYGTEYGILPEVAKENYIFGGWRTGPHGTGTEVTNTTQVTITDNLTLFAYWTRPKFTVTFDPRGGTEDFLTWSYTYGECYGIFGIPSYPGYTFNGWYTALNGGTYIDVTTIMSTPNDHTLYARWTANDYIVSLDPQGGEVTPETLFLQFDSIYDPHPYVPSPPPYVPTPPPFITGLSEHIGYIVPPPPPPPPVEIPPLVVGRMVCPDGTQRVLPGNYESETGRFSFLYDSMPNDITGESSFTMDYSLSAPSGLSDSHWAYQDAL
ncbi:MAG: InlB B-repeat-containing protein [Eubacteriales bacterium]